MITRAFNNVHVRTLRELCGTIVLSHKMKDEKEALNIIAFFWKLYKFRAAQGSRGRRHTQQEPFWLKSSDQTESHSGGLRWKIWFSSAFHRNKMSEHNKYPQNPQTYSNTGTYTIKLGYIIWITERFPFWSTFCLLTAQNKKTDLSILTYFLIVKLWIESFIWLLQATRL